MSAVNFDFDSLPDELILKIFGYLPFKDRVRQSGINRRFHQLSRTAIAQRKTLILDENLMHYVLWSRPFGALLQECSPILEKIVSTNDVLYWCPMVMQPIFQFSYPKLAEIEIKRVFHDLDVSNLRVCYSSFLRMIGECPNLKSFTLDINVEARMERFNFRFPDSVKSTNLENLDIYRCDDESFESMTGAVPNLKSLNVRVSHSDSGVLDNFFATTPVLEKVTLRDIKKFNLETYFWRLPLKSLQLQFNFLNFRNDQNVNDQLIKKISTSFPDLERLALANIMITDDGFRDICSLQALRCLDLDLGSPEEGEGISVESVEFLVNCVKLEKLRLGRPWDNIRLPLNAFVTIIRSCQKLNTIICCGVQELESIDAVLQMLPSFANVKRRIKIGFAYCDWKLVEIWESEAVLAALRQLKENGGAEIEMLDGWRYMGDFTE